MRFTLVVACLLGFTFAAQTQPKKDGGVAIGKIWSVTARKGDGKVKENPPLKLMNEKLRVRGFTIFGLGGKEIGKYKMTKPEQMQVTFTDNQFKDYVVDLSLTLREPPTWRGFGKKEGSDERIWFQFVFEAD